MKEILRIYVSIHLANLKATLISQPLRRGAHKLLWFFRLRLLPRNYRLNVHDCTFIACQSQSDTLGFPRFWNSSVVDPWRGKALFSALIDSFCSASGKKATFSATRRETLRVTPIFSERDAMGSLEITQIELRCYVKEGRYGKNRLLWKQWKSLGKIVDAPKKSSLLEVILKLKVNYDFRLFKLPVWLNYLLLKISQFVSRLQKVSQGLVWTLTKQRIVKQFLGLITILQGFIMDGLTSVYRGNQKEEVRKSVTITALLINHSTQVQQN